MWGKGTQTPFPCPTPPSRLKIIKLLTHVNNLRHHCKCQRRFAPTYSHRVGTVHSHRRNPQYEVSGSDPAVYAAICALLLCVGLLAAVLPAFRASRVDPVIALRQE
jgi:hypothetical protein